jgi:signal transduction histidine kinase
VGKEKSLIAKKITKSAKLVRSSLLSFADQEKISPFGDTTERIKKSALKAQSETHKTVIKLSEKILRQAEPATAPLLEKIDLISKLLSNVVNSFEQYIQRERIEIDDVLTTLDWLTNQLPLIERLVSNAELPMVKKMAHKIDFFKRWILGYAEQETIGNSSSDTLEAIKESALKAQAEAHNLLVELTEVISARINSSQKEMLSDARNMQKFVTAGMTTAVVITLLAAIFMGNALSRPIKRLVEGTEKIAKGELNYRVRIESKDTIGQLATSFNKMAGDVQRTTSSLIQEVNERKKAQELLSRAKEAAETASAELEDQNKKLKQAHEHIVQREKKLKDAQSQLVLSEKMASLGVLISGIAHEINTPAGAIVNVSSDLGAKIKTIINHLMNIHDLSYEELHLLGSLTEQFTNGQFAPESGLQWKKSRGIRKWLAELGVENQKGVVTILSKYNLLDKERLAPYEPLLKKQWAMELMDSFGTVYAGMQICDSSIKKISEIVKALKYYAYTDMDNTSLLDINENIQNVLLLLHNKLKYSLDVEKELQSLPHIHCTSEISQVWTNLISNAHDAVVESKNRDEKGKIRIETSAQDGWVTVQIADNGVGISPENTSKMFDPFYTTKGLGKGTGLGLSIVSGIIKKHKGQISVDSIPGKTTFTVSLPIKNGNGAAING